MNRLSKFLSLQPKYRLHLFHQIIANRFSEEIKLEIKNQQSDNSNSNNQQKFKPKSDSKNYAEHMEPRGDRNYERKRTLPYGGRTRNPYDRVEEPFDQNKSLDKSIWLHRYGRRRHQHGTEVFNFFKTHERRQGKKQEMLKELEQSTELPVLNLKIFNNNKECTLENTKNTFKELGLHPTLQENLDKMGYDQMTDIQKNVISLIGDGKDVMGCAKTGSGKTIAFLLPIMNSLLSSKPPDTPPEYISYPVVLVLAPTRELAEQIYIEARKLSFRTGLIVSRVYGGVPMDPQISACKNGIDILIATPGRLIDLMSNNYINLSLIKALIFDEADRMLDMGFEPQIIRIIEEFQMPSKDKRQNLFFSATFQKEVRELARKYMNDYFMVSVNVTNQTVLNENINHELVYVEKDFKDKLLEIIMSHKGNILVFCEKKSDVDFYTDFLRKNGINAVGLHGDKNQSQRQRAINDFSDGKVEIMVTTNVGSRGIDFPHVSYVINTSIPIDIEDYVHRVGRTGRSGLKGTAITLVDPRKCSFKPLVNLEDLLLKYKQEVPDWFTELGNKLYNHNNNHNHNNNRNQEPKRGKGKYANPGRNHDRSHKKQGYERRMDGNSLFDLNKV